MDGNNESRAEHEKAPTEPSPLRRVNVADLLAGDRELILVHRQSEYRLRLTNNDKLILTK